MIKEQSKTKALAVCSVLVIGFLLSACAGTKNLALDTTFPVPLIDKLPMRLGVYLDEDLRGYVYNEKLEKKGEWNVDVGSVQTELFTNLAAGLFEGHQLVTETSAPNFDGVLEPEITDLQFSLPTQTRSNFYEVWIRYNFKLYDSNGNTIGDWPLPAYGKASKEDFSSASSGVEAAAVAACRDAMAFFVLNFQKVPAVKQWLAAGKPQLPPAPAPIPAPAAESASPGEATDSQPSTSTEPSAST
ncbi:MAG: hypothetical protein GKR90_05805 [Pseudomonadales bacterium]|nr:hypothetical protein [Pseudomonadales bacterium]